jgi:hypothetical protein
MPASMKCQQILSVAWTGCEQHRHRRIYGRAAKGNQMPRKKDLQKDINKENTNKHKSI